MIQSLVIANRGEIACRINLHPLCLRTFAYSLEPNATCGGGPSVSAAHCHLPQASWGRIEEVRERLHQILSELVSGRGTARVAGGGGAFCA